MSWPTAKLSDVAPAKPLKIKAKENDAVWQVTLDHIESQTGLLLERNIKPFSEAGGSTHGFDNRHVLYSKLRPYLNKVLLPDQLGLGTTELVPLLPDVERLDRKYLAYYLKSPKFVSWISSQIAGAKMPRVAMGTFWEHEIPLPPLPEQKRIAAILDKADAIRRKRQQAIKLADEFLVSLFLANGCEPIKAKMPKEGYSKSGWKWMRLTDLARLESGHTPSRKVAEYWGGSVKWLSLKDVKSIRNIYIRDTADKPTEAGISNSSARLLPKGTVALCRTASVGACVILGDEMATSQDFVDWVCGDELLPEFLYTVLKCSGPEFEKLKQGSTHKTIYMPTVREFCIYLPPIHIQAKIANAMKWVSQVSLRNTERLALCSDLFCALSQRSFG